MTGILLNINEYPYKVAIKVENYSKKNVINAICSYTGTDTKIIEQISVNAQGCSLYGCKAIVCHSLKIIKEITEYKCPDYPIVFEVECINIL